MWPADKGGTNLYSAFNRLWLLAKNPLASLKGAGQLGQSKAPVNWPAWVAPPCCGKAKAWANTGRCCCKLFLRASSSDWLEVNTTSSTCNEAPCCASFSSSWAWVLRGQGQGPISFRLRSSMSTKITRRSSCDLANKRQAQSLLSSCAAINHEGCKREKASQLSSATSKLRVATPQRCMNCTPNNQRPQSVVPMSTPLGTDF